MITRSDCRLMHCHRRQLHQCRPTCAAPAPALECQHQQPGWREGVGRGRGPLLSQSAVSLSHLPSPLCSRPLLPTTRGLARSRLPSAAVRWGGARAPAFTRACPGDLSWFKSLGEGCMAAHWPAPVAREHPQQLPMAANGLNLWVDGWSGSRDKWASGGWWRRGCTQEPGGPARPGWSEFPHYSLHTPSWASQPPITC